MDPRLRLLSLHCVAAIAAAVLVGAAPGPVLAAGRPSATKLLPRNTGLLVWAPDVSELTKRFLRTATGQMGQDPAIQPLVTHFYHSAVEAAAPMKERIGLGLPELLSIPQGEFAFAVVASEEDGPSPVLLCDAGSRLALARLLLDRMVEELDKSGAERSEETVADVKLVSYQSGRRRNRVSFFEKDSTVVVGASLGVVRQILDAWVAKPGSALADNEKFASVLRRSRDGDKDPPLVAYADPIMLFRCAADRNPGMQIAVAMLPILGLDGLQAVGGGYLPDAGPLDSVLHLHVLTTSPRTGVFEVVATEKVDPTPEPWVPADVAGYSTLQWRFDTSFKRLGSLFDSFRGDGAWGKWLRARVQEPIGLDVEKELLPLLEGRVSLMVQVERPVTPEGRRSLLAVRLKDPAEATKVLGRLAEKNATTMTGHSFAGRMYYETSMRRPIDKPLAKPPAPDEGGGEPPPQPAICLGVVDDYLVFSDQIFLRKVLSEAAGSREPLADALEYKLVASRFRRLSSGGRLAMVSFSRPDENLRNLYELAQSESMRKRLKEAAERDQQNWFVRALHAALDANPLPSFETISRYYAPSGAVLVDDESGLHYTSFSLRRAAK